MLSGRVLKATTVHPRALGRLHSSSTPNSNTFSQEPPLPKFHLCRASDPHMMSSKSSTKADGTPWGNSLSPTQVQFILKFCELRKPVICPHMSRI